jgi:hypothetical protein
MNLLIIFGEKFRKFSLTIIFIKSISFQLYCTLLGQHSGKNSFLDKIVWNFRGDCDPVVGFNSFKGIYNKGSNGQIH